MSTCSEAAFLVVTDLCVRGGRNSGPMPTAAHRVSITLAATSEFQGQLQEAGAATDESRGVNEAQKRGNEISVMTRLCTGLQMLVKLDHIGHAAATSCRTIPRMSCRDAYQLYRTINTKLCVICRFNGRPTQHKQQVQKPLQMHGVIIRIRIDTSRIFVDRKLWPRVHAAARDFGTPPQISACIVRSLSTSQLTVQHLRHIGCCVCGLPAGSVVP